MANRSDGLDAVVEKLVREAAERIANSYRLATEHVSLEQIVERELLAPMQEFVREQVALAVMGAYLDAKQAREFRRRYGVVDVSDAIGQRTPVNAQKAQADEREYRRKLEDELRDKDESLRQFMRATTKLQDEKAEVLLKRDAEWRALLDRALGPGHSAQSCDDETAIRRTVAERERVAREDEAKKWLGLIPMYGADAANLWAKQRLAELKSPKHPGTL